MPRHLHIRTNKFPILEGEEEEVVNPGTYGKAFAGYVSTVLAAAGYQVPFFCGEDWGWWVEVKLPEKIIGILCNREHDSSVECHFNCTTSTDGAKVWSWPRFCFVDIRADVADIHKVLSEAFIADPEIHYLGESEEGVIKNLERLADELNACPQGSTSIQRELVRAILVLIQSREKKGGSKWDDCDHRHIETLQTWLLRDDPSGRIARDIAFVKNRESDAAEPALYRLSADVFLWCLARHEPIPLP